MLLMSWNVAGLSTTVQRIHETYSKSAITSSKNEKKQSALEHFLDLHHVDIICLQEHKIPYSQLSNRSEPHQCASSLKHYESFWSKTTASGMNGVVTYVRKSSSSNTNTDAASPIKATTIRANASPLGSPDLDDQGRCIVTEHADFVLFNVYVPCNGGHALSDKMKFLYALEEAMDRYSSKPVILLGDLNITHRGIDKFWLDRTILVDDVVDSVVAATVQDEGSPPSQAQRPAEEDQWKRDVAIAWPRILQALITKEVVQVQTTNPTTGAKFQKYRLLVTVDSYSTTKEIDDTPKRQQKKVYLGKHESKADYCSWQYNFTESTYICPRTGDCKVSSRADTVSLGVLAELLSKIAGIHWDGTTLRHISQSLLLHESGGVCPNNPPRQWLNEYLMRKRNMVDVFRHLYPAAQGRYTCWNQNTNRRYANEGARIDYIWVDPQLLPRVLQGSGKEDATALRCGPPVNNAVATTHDNKDSCNPLSEEAALRAATASGQFRPVSYGGEGIASAPKKVLDTQFLGQPHTGMIYTPPSFSDHIGVSVLLQEYEFGANVPATLNDKKFELRISDDKETKRTQPHKTQRSIAAFLTAKRPAPSASTITTTQKKRPKAAKRKPNTILHHFGGASSKK